MILVFVALVSTSVIEETGAMGGTSMKTLIDTLYTDIGFHLYSERLSNILFVFNVSELAFPRWLGGCCLNSIQCRRQEGVSSLPKI